MSSFVLSRDAHLIPTNVFASDQAIVTNNSFFLKKQTLDEVGGTISKVYESIELLVTRTGVAFYF